jgi:hypothetical protein
MKVSNFNQRSRRRQQRRRGLATSDARALRVK